MEDYKKTHASNDLPVGHPDKLVAGHYYSHELNSYIFQGDSKEMAKMRDKSVNADGNFRMVKHKSNQYVAGDDTSGIHR